LLALILGEDEVAVFSGRGSIRLRVESEQENISWQDVQHV